MRSDLARAPVTLQPPQRPGLDDYKKSSPGSYTGVSRQPSAGRKPPQGKIILPEFPRRTAVGSGTGSYAALGGAARSTSVPRPSSRASATQIPPGAGSAANGGSHAAAPSAGGSAAGTPTAHTSPRSAVRPPAAGPSSILDSLTTPSVLPSGTRASLAQRMNSSSILDYGMLAGGTSTSAVRIKRQAGSMSGDPATAAATGAQPVAPPVYSTLTPSADQLRAMYLSGPAAGTSGGGVGSPAAAAAAAAASAAGRRASIERSAVERILSRTNSFSSQSGAYGAGIGGPASPVSAGGAPSAQVPVATAAPPPGATSASGSAAYAVYASQYAHQYGTQAGTVHIPTFSQHGLAGTPAAMYSSGGAGSGGGGGAAPAAHYVQQPPPRPATLSVPLGAPLPPVVLSPSSPSAPPHLGPAAQLYPGASAADYATRPLQRAGSTSLSRPVVGSAGGAGGGGTVTPAPSRLRALTTAADDDTASADGGNNSSLRRVQMQEAEQPRWSGSGAALPPPPAATAPHAPAVAGGPYPGAGSGHPPASSKPAACPANAAAGEHLPAQQQRSQPVSHQQQQHQHPQQHHLPHPHLHPHPHAPVGVGVPAGAALDAGGTSYTSTTSSTASAVSSSSNKSSVAAAGTGVSSASTSRTTSSISQRSAADALAAHGQAGAGATHGSSVGRHPAAGATTSVAARSQRAGGVGGSTAGGSVRSSSEAMGGALMRVQSGIGPGVAVSQEHEAVGPVCGPLPDLPLVVAPRDALPGRGCVGLQNLGNTCFMNSILQSLNAVPELVQQFLNPSDRNWSSKAVVAPAYSGLVRDMMSGLYGSCVNPSGFLRKVSKHDCRWGEGRQQDSQEFLNSVLEAMQTECNRIPSKPVYRELQGKGSEEAQAQEAFAYARSWNDSIVDDIFGGLTQSTIQCHACKRLSHTFEPFLGLAVPIPAAAAAGGGGGGDPGRADAGGGPVSIADCLRAFVECEELQGDDSYKCETCKRRQPHSKRMQIFRPPRVLVLTLKRFAQRPPAPGFFSRFRSAAKNNTPVRLDPEPLDLAPYCNTLGLRGLAVRGRPGPLAPVYQLTAVSHHSGSLEGGHYTAQARSCLDGHWYSFNDSCVRREAARPSGTSSSAYVLFYRLASLPPPAAALGPGAGGVASSSL